MTVFRSLLMPAIVGVTMLGACQMTEAKTPAVLASTDNQSMDRLKSVLSKAMNTARIEIGPGDLTETSTVSVLPPNPGPLEGNSPAMPTVFTIMMQGSACYLVRQDTGEEYALDGVDCHSVQK